ncbi:hypothetical protein FACS1894122_02440 [Alphaproteobacteria bacterium]|nr:hypothetical protein FACS1894122_02440 [Alphaproteobacteria bacterium]
MKAPHISFFLSLLLLIACDDESSDEFSHRENVAEAEAEITCVEYNDMYITAIQYDVPESLYEKSADKSKKRSIQQSWLEKNKPIDHQKIRIEYLKYEPICFRKIDEIKFE